MIWRPFHQPVAHSFSRVPGGSLLQPVPCCTTAGARCHDHTRGFGRIYRVQFGHLIAPPPISVRQGLIFMQNTGVKNFNRDLTFEADLRRPKHRS